MKEEYTREEISMILDTYMYTNYMEANDGETLKTIIENMPANIDVTGDYKEEYAILSDAVQNPQIGNLRIRCQSRKMGYNEGTNAVTFISEDGKDAYVVFRGTHDGEWLDNGDGLVLEETTQQREAVRYYDEVVEILKPDKKTNLTITGHSKGGNKAQYVTMDSQYGGLINRCYSIDGQGHSDAAINKWKTRYSESEYNARVEKIYAVNGQNDFVSVLGNSIILAGHTAYIATPADKTDFAAYHDITHMFAHQTVDENGTTDYEYSSERNGYVLKRGELGDYVSVLSSEVMEMPETFREGSTTTLMQVAEAVGGDRKIGLNGEYMTLSDLKKFELTGVPVIAYSLLATPQGAGFLDTLINKDGFSLPISDFNTVDVDYEALDMSAANLKEACNKINALLALTEATGLSIPLYVDGIGYKRAMIENSIIKLKVIEMKLSKLAAIQADIASLYRKFDNESEKYFKL